MSTLVALQVLAWSLPLPLAVQFVIAVVLPLLVGLVTTRVTRSGVKAVLLLALSFFSSFFTELATSLANSNPFDVGLWLLGAAGTFAVGVMTHFGLYKPTGVAASVEASGVKQKRNPDGTFA